MKIKIIDLLVKIVNREAVPKKIKYKNEIYERYQNTTINNLYYYQVPNKCKFLIVQLSSVGDLLDEVEIIEEPKKIKKLPKEITDNVCATRDQKIIANKIDELIDEINNLKEKSNESSNNKSK